MLPAKGLRHEENRHHLKDAVVSNSPKIAARPKRNSPGASLPFGQTNATARVNREEALADLEGIPEEMDRHRAGIAALAARRRARVEALLADGMTQAAIARRLRVTQRAIAKIIGR